MAYPLFDRLPGLRALPKLDLAHPTPVERLTRLEAAIGSHASLWVKRDDRTSPVYGGNKPRKLEWTLAPIARSPARCEVITGGGIGSHMTVAAAAFCRQLGIAIEAVLFEHDVDAHVRENLLLDKHFGARLHLAGGYVGLGVGLARTLVRSYAAHVARSGPRPVFVMPGDSHPLSILGFVNAALELEEQIRRGELPVPDALFVTAGSCGTMAGLVVGLRLAGLATRVVGVRVCPRVVTNAAVVRRLASATLAFLAREAGGEGAGVAAVAQLRARGIRGDAFTMLHDYAGAGYACATTAGREAVRLFDEHEGLPLDNTYTGKTAAALIELARGRGAGPWRNVLFWNTLSSVDLSEAARSVRPESVEPAFRRFLSSR